MDNQDDNQESQATGQPSNPETTTPDGSSKAGMPSSPDIPQVISSNQKPKKRWLKILTWLIILAAIAGAGWFAYQHYVKKEPAPTVSTTASKDISNLNIGLQHANYGRLYPNMNINEYNYIINAQLFEGLVRYENKSKIVPNIASDWTNPDNNTWIFTINKGIKFHDGNTLTAKDVKYSLDTIRSSTTGDNNLDISQTFANTIKSVDVINDNQVKITTTVPDPILLNKLTFLYIIDANLPKDNEPSQAGTGPYEIKPGTKPTGTNVQMVAYDEYHGGHVATRALEFNSEEETSALLDGFKTGKYDIIGANLTIQNQQDIKNVTKYSVDESAVFFLGLNTVNPGPLKNKLVREAIRYSLDPQAIGKVEGAEVEPLSQLVPPAIPGYNPTLTTYKQDIPKAKKLLAKAGYPHGVTITFSTGDDPAKYTEIIKELKAAGITVKPDYYTDFDKFINKFTSGQAEMYDIIYSSDTVDGLDMYTSNAPDTYYVNPELKSLLDKASTTTDQAKRLKMLQDAATTIDEDIPVVPLYAQKDVYWMNKDYAIQQDMPSSLMSVYFYKVHLN